MDWGFDVFADHLHCTALQDEDTEETSTPDTGSVLDILREAMRLLGPC